jgi:hypothetical protein
VKLAASDALLLAGLRRAASLAGLTECDDVAEATMSMRSSGAGTSHPKLDIEVAEDEIVIRLDGAVSADLWRTIAGVVDVLYSGRKGRAQVARLARCPR